MFKNDMIVAIKSNRWRESLSLPDREVKMRERSKKTPERIPPKINTSMIRG